MGILLNELLGYLRGWYFLYSSVASNLVASIALGYCFLLLQLWWPPFFNGSLNNNGVFSEWYHSFHDLMMLNHSFSSSFKWTLHGFHWRNSRVKCSCWFFGLVKSWCSLRGLLLFFNWDFSIVVLGDNWSLDSTRTVSSRDWAWSGCCYCSLRRHSLHLLFTFTINLCNFWL
jgi:hypothetical protein